MRKLLVLVLVATCTAAAFGAPARTASAHDDGAGLLVAVMTGNQEVPGPGDRDGVGFVVALAIPRLGVFCYAIKVFNIDPATAAHIHRGPAGVAGPIVIPLKPPRPDVLDCIGGVSTTLLAEIVSNPSGFYANVHNAAFPAGAIRGQLRAIHLGGDPVESFRSMAAQIAQ